MSDSDQPASGTANDPATGTRSEAAGGPGPDLRRFRNALGRFVTGVTVVTARGPDGTDVGVTANSFNSVSLQPPMVLWSIARNSNSLPAFEATDHFAVHVLGSGQRALSDRFASRTADRFADLELGRGHGSVPLIAGSAAVFQCRTAHRYDGGDHLIIVGEVLEFDEASHPPLIYHGGRYGLVAEGGATESGQPDAGERTLFALVSALRDALASGRAARAGELGLSDTGLLSVSEPAGGVALTGRVEALAGKLAAIEEAVEAEALAALDPGERDTLKRLLARIAPVTPTP